MRLTIRQPLLIALPLLVVAPFAQPVKAQGGTTANTPPATGAAAPAATQPAPKETYESAMQAGAEERRRAVSQTGADASKTLDSARDAFIRAVSLAPDNTKKAEAYIASAEVSAGRNLWIRANTDYNYAALLKDLPPALLIKATLGEGGSAYEYRKQDGTLKSNGYAVRMVYERALKIPQLSTEQRLMVQEKVAEMYVIEARPAEAGREYEKLAQLQAGNRETSLQTLRLAAWYSGAEQRKNMATNAMTPADTGLIIDKIFGQLIAREPAAKKSTLQLEWVQALMAHYNADRAVTLLSEIKDDNLLPLTARKGLLRQIVATQSGTPEKALLTWEALRKLPGNTPAELAQIASDRAAIYLKLKKEPELRGEYQALLATNPSSADKVNAWHQTGLSWNRQRQARPATATAEIQSDLASAQTAFETAWNMADAPIDKRIDSLIERANIEAGAQRLPIAREWLQKGFTATSIDAANKQRLQFVIAISYGFEKKHAESLTAYQAALAEPVTIYKTEIGKSLLTAVGAAFTERNWDAARNYLAEVEKGQFATPAGILFDKANIENQAGNKEAALAALTSLENTYGAQMNANDKATVANLRKQIQPPPVSLTGN